MISQGVLGNLGVDPGIPPKLCADLPRPIGVAVRSTTPAANPAESALRSDPQERARETKFRSKFLAPRSSGTDVVLPLESAISV